MQLEKDQKTWPDFKIESVYHCPMCKSEKKRIAYQNVEDWAFYNSNGQWNYWECLNCNTLFQSPRPTKQFISEAYESYYTHGDNQSKLQLLKIKIKNEIYSNLFNIQLQPRFNFNKKLSFITNSFRRFIYVPFGLKQIVNLPKGKILDIGCGDGSFLKIAQSLGWQAFGLEIDSKAVNSAIQKGINAKQGTYEDLSKTHEKYDCIVCSHVLEHVHEPVELLNIMLERLANGGTILLSCPNSLSHMRFKFNENWRGIEAPRHLAIPSPMVLRNYFEDRGYKVNQEFIYYGTYIESIRIKKRQHHISFFEFICIKLKLLFAKIPSDISSDYIQLVITKKDNE